MTETSIWHEVQKFEIGRNFSNKLWNACRFLYPQLEQAGALAAELPMDKNGVISFEYDGEIYSGYLRSVKTKFQGEEPLEYELIEC